MIFAPLLALALFAQDATAAAQTPAAPAAAAAQAEGPIPPGAPEDDYGLVNWCHGALGGHMQLYTQVKPTLDGLQNDPKVQGGGVSPGSTTAEMDQQQMAAGREYLALYERAIAAAEKANPRIRARGQQAEAKGAGIWTPASNAVDPKTTMWSWLMWELPGRCETAAKRLEERSLLLAPATNTE